MKIFLILILSSLLSPLLSPVLCSRNYTTELITTSIWDNNDAMMYRLLINVSTSLYLLLKAARFLGANDTESASVGLYTARDAI